MDLLDRVLQGVPDHRPLLERMGNSEAICALVDEYNLHSRTLFHVPEMVTGLTIGADFKEALRQLDPDDQLRLLYKYSDVLHGRHKLPKETVEKVEERRLRHFVVRSVTIVGSAGVFLIAGAMVAFAYKSGALADGAIVSSIIGPAMEILKLIFQIGVK